MLTQKTNIEVIEVMMTITRPLTEDERRAEDEHGRITNDFIIEHIYIVNIGKPIRPTLDLISSILYPGYKIWDWWCPEPDEPF